MTGIKQAGVSVCKGFQFNSGTTQQPRRDSPSIALASVNLWQCGMSGCRLHDRMDTDGERMKVQTGTSGRAMMT